MIYLKKYYNSSSLLNETNCASYSDIGGGNMHTRVHQSSNLKSFFFLLVMSLWLTVACSQATPTISPGEDISQPRQPDGIDPTDTVVPPSEPTLANPAPPTAEAQQPTQWQHNWLHFGVDTQFSSYKLDDVQITVDNVADLKLIEGYGCDDGLFSVIGGTPAIYHGQLIVTYAGGKLELGDPYSGEKVWEFGESAYGWAPPPVVSSDGVIYYLYVTADASSRLFAVNSETGGQIWEAPTQFKTGFNFEAQVTVDEKNDLIYIIEDEFGNGRLWALDRGSGEIKWFLGDDRQQEGEMTFAGSIVLLKDDKLYVPAYETIEHSKRKHMLRVDPMTQAVDLKYSIPADLNLSWGVGWYGICNNRMFETYQDSSRKAIVLAAHALDQPGIAWQINIPAQTGRLACDPDKDIVYFPTEDSLLALDAATGTSIWEHKSLNSVFTPTIANGIIYYISDTNMYAVDQANGSQLFRYPLGIEGDPSTGVAVNDGLVVFSGNGGTCDLYVLGLE
jgi:outer membrane protein assembly factor BamB